MARPIKTRGFTLVELLVVITIIGMLVSLLLPAIQSARESGRRATCSNNMRNVALALIQQAETKRGFAGYVSAVPKGTGFVRASWVVSVLPNLERNDLYQNWMNTNLPIVFSTTTPRSLYVSQLAILNCPSFSAPELGDNPLSYVINTGSALSANDTCLRDAMGNPVPSDMTYAGEDTNSGVSFNHSNWITAPTGNGKKVTLDFLNTNDGTTNTLLLTENLQAGGWGMSPNLDAGNVMGYVAGGPNFYQNDVEVRQNTGTVFYITGLTDNAGPPSAAVSSMVFDPATIGINDQSQAVIGPIQRRWIAGQTYPSGLAYSRPSANHNGGVNAYFCGGNNRYLSEDMEYKVYTQLMTPNQKSLNRTPNLNTVLLPIKPPAVGAWTYQLNEADL